MTALLFGVPFRGGRQQVLRNLSIVAVLAVIWFAAHETWGVQNVGVRISYPDGSQPRMRVVVINRSDSLVRFDCADAKAGNPGLLAFAHERAFLDLMEPTGAPPHWTVAVRPLSLEAPGAVERTVDWSDATERPRSVLVAADGSAQLQPWNTPPRTTSGS